MKNLLYLLTYLFFFPGITVHAASPLACSHQQLCQMANLILTEAGRTNVETKTLVHMTGDPHEFEPTINEIKKLIDAPVLITGPTELNPWMTKVSYQRSKVPGLKTIALKLDSSLAALYPGASNEALSHFWLYPRIYCQMKKSLAEKLSAVSKKDLCLTRADEIELKLKKTLASLQMPVILTHDAILPLLLSLKKDGQKLIAIKGSGHHAETSTTSVKKLYDVLSAPAAIWIIEDGIHVPKNILDKKRSSDFVIKIATDVSDTQNPFSILENLNQSLIPFAGKTR